MVIEIFGFIFHAIASFINFWLFQAKLDGPITFGMFILVAFVIGLIVNKLLGIARTEYEETQAITRRDKASYKRKEQDANMGKHAYYKPRHRKD